MKHYRNLLYIGFVILLAYSPVASFLFALKNDFFTQYFPQRFFIGEAVRHGTFPLWNPYINYGIPVFADMNAGFWYPFTWLNALITGYNAYSFTIEELLHIVIAGTGMYWLTGYWNLTPQARIIAAISYACSGFITGQLQHYNWITGAAWLPWCTRTLLQYYTTPVLKKLIPAVVFFSLLLTGSHPGISIGAVYFFAILTLQFFLSTADKRTNWYAPLVFISVLLLLTSGMIYSYGEMFSLFTRSNPVTASEIQLNAVDSTSFLSLVFPLSSVKSAYDIALQNMYMGITMLVSAFAGIFIFRSSKTIHFFVIGIFFFFISSNLPLSGILLDHLPLLNYVRLNAEFRIFGILSLIIFAADSFSYLYNNRPGLLTRIYQVLGGICFLGLLPLAISNAPGLFQKLSRINGKQSIKDLLDQLLFNETILINTLVLVLLFAGLIFALGRKKQWFIHLAVLDLVIATLLNLPFTGIGMRSVGNIQVLVDGSPQGFPKPEIKAEMALLNGFPETDKIIGNWSMYSKQIAIKEWFPYPIVLETSSNYFDRKHHSQLAQQKPFIFPASGSHDYRIKAFKPSFIEIQDHVLQPGNLVIKQNDYPGWQTYVMGEQLVRNELYGPFPLIPLDAGNQTISRRFEKPAVVLLFVVFSLGFFLMVWYTIISSGTSFRSRL